MIQKIINWGRHTLAVCGHFKWQAILLFVMFIVLFIMYWPSRQSYVSQSVWEVLDPVAGISAFILSLIILYNQAYARWEESLEKQLTVHFINSRDDTEIAIVERAYLSGESDIRPWAQQLGSQIFGTMKLDMNWDEAPPKIVSESHRGKTIFAKLYEITIYIQLDDSLKEKIATFVENGKSFKHSSIEANPDNLPVRWIRTT